MKFKNLFQTSLIVLLTLTIFSCSDDDDNTFNPTTTTIAEFVTSNADYSSLLAALQKAELVETLAGNGSFTVFAPDNDAFDAFLTDAGLTLETATKEELTPILLNHVLGSEFASTQLTTRYEDNLAGFSTYINVSDGAVKINGDVTVTTADLEQSNGVIHAVDKVITLPSIVTFATSDPNFSTLTAALTGLTPDTDYAAVLSTPDGTAPAPFTVFAPTNDAFTDLLARFNIEIGDLTAAQLEIVLNYHVIAGAKVLAADLPGITDGVTPATLQGESLNLNLEGGAFLRDKTGVDSEIIATDVKATNGVIHAINKVLLPNAALDALGKSFTAVAYNGGEEPNDFSSLYAALRYTGLNDALDNAMMRTVFAPTNAAFTTLLDGANLTDLPVEAVTQILLNHVVSGKILSSDLSTSYANTLATYGDTTNNLSIYINTDAGVVLNGGSSNGGATVSTADVETRNGVIHEVDAVIGLPTVATFAAADPGFSSLAGALTSVGLVEALQVPNGTGTPQAPFTVFAPTNAAFDALPIVPTGDALAAVLTYHVIADSNVRSTDLVSVAGEVPTVNGANVTISADPATVKGIGNMTASNITVVDVQAANGVIHAIDQVLSPTM